jgi:predicted alpha/beta-hydrolase family hydrolase
MSFVESRRHYTGTRKWSADANRAGSTRNFLLVSSIAVTIAVEGAHSVSGLWLAPSKIQACLVLAHGAGAGMSHKSMEAISNGLAERGIATLRYQFPYMERGGKRVDPPKIAHAAVRAAVADARRRALETRLFAGGKSFGGRMTSQAQALSPLEGVRGLVFFAFPLHPAGKSSDERAEHFADVALPMLFLQGTRDALADLEILRRTVAGLGERATLSLFAEADHAFHVPAKSGSKDAEVLSEMLDAAAVWMLTH